MKTNNNTPEIFLDSNKWEIIVFGKENSKKWGKIAIIIPGFFTVLAGKNFKFKYPASEYSNKLLDTNLKITERRKPTEEEFKIIRERFYSFEKRKSL